jgi:hypothetical protein
VPDIAIPAVRKIREQSIRKNLLRPFKLLPSSESACSSRTVRYFTSCAFAFVVWLRWIGNMTTFRINKPSLRLGQHGPKIVGQYAIRAAHDLLSHWRVLSSVSYHVPTTALPMTQSVYQFHVPTFVIRTLPSGCPRTDTLSSLAAAYKPERNRLRLLSSVPTPCTSKCWPILSF